LSDVQLYQPRLPMEFIEKSLRKRQKRLASEFAG
jgi:hypothetical protein